MDEIKDMIKAASEKDATGFEAAFQNAISPKIDAALSAKYDDMFGVEAEATEAEVESSDVEENESEQEQG